MTDVANELEAIYEALSSAVATSEQRRIAYEAFERLKNAEESFVAARDVVRRRKNEGSVYTALLVIEHHINHFWRRISQPHLLEFISDVLTAAAALNSNLVAVGASNVGYAAALHNSRFLDLFFFEYLKKSPNCAELFFLIVDKLLLTVTDYCKNFPNHIRQDLRAFFIKNSGKLFSEAYYTINNCFNDNINDTGYSSSKIINSIFGAVSQLISSELSLIRDIIKNEELCKKFISLSFLLLDRFSHKYHENCVIFLKNFADKILMIVTPKSPIDLFISDDKLLTLTTFIKSCSNYSTRYESALFFNGLVRMLVDSSESCKEMYPNYVFDVLNSLVHFSEPAINVTSARILHIYSLGIFRSHKTIYHQYFENIVDLYFKIAVNYKKGEFTVNYNSIQEDNLSLKESENIIYRFAISIFTSDQFNVMLKTSKYAQRIVVKYLYEDSMNPIDCYGITFGLKNISNVADNSIYTNMKRGNHNLQQKDSEDYESLSVISNDLLTKLIEAPMKNLQQLNCFLELSLSILNHFYIHPEKLDIYLRTLHQHILGFIQATKDYQSLHIDTIYWSRRCNKSLSALLKAIMNFIKDFDKNSDEHIFLATIVNDVAMNMCILDWVEREHLENFIFIQNYKPPNIKLQSTYSFFISMMKTYFDNPLIITGLSSTDRFLEVFSIGDEVIRPESFEPLRRLYQLISLVYIFYNDLKTHEPSSLIMDPLFQDICKISVDVYTLVQKIWKCYCGIFDSTIQARRTPQLLKAITGIQLKMVECSYEQKYTAFESLEHRIYFLGKHLISCFSALFIINMKYFSDTSLLFTKTFCNDMWKPFLTAPFILIPYFSSSIFISYIDTVKEPRSHRLFLESFVEIFEDLSKVISNRCTIIRKKLEEIEQSNYTDEGNDIVEASNVTDEVIFALSRLCFRFLDNSTFVHLDIAKIINENTEPEPTVASRFECIAYTHHPTWIAAMKLAMTLVSFGNSKLITRVCNNNFFDNQVKLRISHIEQNPSLYSALVTYIFTSLYTAYKNKEIYYQAGIIVVNMLIYIITSFKNVYPGIGVLLQQITGYPSSATINQTMNLISQTNVPLKEKRQAVIRILDRVTDENENINLLMNELENFTVAESEKPKYKYDLDYKALSDSDLVDIRFLFE